MIAVRRGRFNLSKLGKQSTRWWLHFVCDKSQASVCVCVCVRMCAYVTPKVVVHASACVCGKLTAYVWKLKAIGCDTAKSVLDLNEEELVRRTDLEEETIKEIYKILKSEFEEE